MFRRLTAYGMFTASLMGFARLYLDVEILFHLPWIRELSFENPTQFIALLAFWTLGFMGIGMAFAGGVRLPMFETAFMIGFVLSLAGVLNSDLQSITLSMIAFSVMTCSVTASCVLLSLWFDHFQMSIIRRLRIA